MIDSFHELMWVSIIFTTVASLPAAKLGLGAEMAGLEKPSSPKSPSASPQEVIQHFKPQAGVKTVSAATRLPDKIMAILLSEEAPDAIWWLQKGTAFAMQKEKFQTQILDIHFRGNKFKSLVRNLHRWYDITTALFWRGLFHAD